MAKSKLDLLPYQHAAEALDLSWVIGFDEVGVGCLAGPVVAAAFAYPLTPAWLELREIPVSVRDSKTLLAPKRLASRDWLAQQAEALFEVVEVTPAEIDEINILRASQLAMQRCFEKLQSRLRDLGHFFSPGQRAALLVDGNRLPRAFEPLSRESWHVQTIVKGDRKSFAIAAASILAKEHRDSYMERLAGEFPDYGWGTNVGYPTPDHKEAIRQHGPTVHHRRSFNWV